MSMVFPEWAISTELLLTGVLSLVAMVWTARAAYSRIMAKLDTLATDIEAMKARNIRADHETEEVKAEQAEQKTSVAVMSAQITNISAGMTRVEAAIGKLADKMDRRGP